ncbi:hypothetical protein HIM_01918 [Hirsutella minnesotensis 3608]|nr:hypothetical protein HIM_01918 [Hirsutella minnesotensis 3608]
MDIKASVDPIYLSFNDIELLQPPSVPSPPNSRGSSGVHAVPQQRVHQHATHHHAGDAGKELGQQQQPVVTAFKMQRQDSGYESYTTTPRASMSPPSRRLSNASSTGVGSASRPRTRASTRRSAKSYPQAGSSSPALHQLRSHAGPYSAAYFQFPTPDLDLVELAETSSNLQDPGAQHQPPQTTHYWTSDSTRRLEYAAIDAASRGVRGWVRRHLVPGCFGPRHVSFDDDSGSVRRYRLDLDDDEEDDDEKIRANTKRTKGWRFWGLRKSKTV